MTLKQMFSGKKAKTIDDFFNGEDKKKHPDKVNFFSKLRQERASTKQSQPVDL